MVLIGLSQKKMIKNLDTALFAYDVIIFFDEYSGNFTFATDEMGILCVNLYNINLGGANFYEDDLKTIIHVRLLAWNNKLKQCKAFKWKITIIINACSMKCDKMVGLVHVKR